jgi:hypothetical protein
LKWGWYVRIFFGFSIGVGLALDALLGIRVPSYIGMGTGLLLMMIVYQKVEFGQVDWLDLATDVLELQVVLAGIGGMFGLPVALLLLTFGVMGRGWEAVGNGVLSGGTVVAVIAGLATVIARASTIADIRPLG